MKTITLILMICLTSFFAKGDVSIYADHYTILPNTNVEIPIKASGLTNFFGLQFSLEWDSTILSFVSIDNLTTTLPSLNTGDIGIDNSSKGIVKFIWSEPFPDCTTNVPDNTTIFTITLKAKGQIGDVSSLSFAELEAINCFLGLIPITGETGSVTLPVELKKFTVSPSYGANLLEWEVAQEEKLDGYEIQRSKDGLAFETISWQESEAEELQNYRYTFVDNDIGCTSILYYRLKMRELNGDYEYSDIVVSRQPNSPSQGGLKINNPFNNALNIKTCENLGTTIELYNLAGQKILSTIMDNGNSITINTGHLPSGVYVAKVGEETVKLFKQ